MKLKHYTVFVENPTGIMAEVVTKNCVGQAVLIDRRGLVDEILTLAQRARQHCDKVEVFVAVGNGTLGRLIATF